MHYFLEVLKFDGTTVVSSLYLQLSLSMLHRYR